MYKKYIALIVLFLSIIASLLSMISKDRENNTTKIKCTGTLEIDQESNEEKNDNIKFASIANQ